MGIPQPQSALLINPFYPKDPQASFGKHVLTPTLALTSIAGATPPDWRVEYWDENLLQGPPPFDPFPEVVGITVHLTFAQRAYGWPDWYRSAGPRWCSAGCTSCPVRTRRRRMPTPWRSAKACSSGRNLEGCRARPLQTRLSRRLSPAVPRRSCRRGAPCFRADQLSDHHQPDRDARLPQSLRLLLPLNRRLHMPYLMRDVEQIATEFDGRRQPYAVFIDNNLGSRPRYLRQLCRAMARLGKIWSAAVTIDVTDDPGLVREMALSGCAGVFVGFESITAENLEDAHKKTPRPRTMRDG